MIFKLKNIFPQLKTLKPPILCVTFFILFAFSACSDDPVTPQESEFDPPRFEWKVDTVTGYIVDFWAQDENNVFMVDALEALVHYDGEKYTYHNYGGNFQGRAIEGLSNNEIYVAGRDPFQDIPVMRKWNGANFEHIIINDTPQVNSAIYDIFINSANEIWLASLNGRVYKYDGITFNMYYFDPLMFMGPFLKDEYGNLFLHGTIWYFNPPSNDSDKVFIYKFNNNNWDLVYYRLSNNNTSDTLMNIRNIGNVIAGVNYNGVRKFDGKDFHKVISADNFSIYPRYHGSSFTDILCPGFQLQTTSKDIYHWNGLKWSKENILFNNYIQDVYGINDTYFCSTYDIVFKTYLFIGKKRKENMIKLK